MYYIFVNMIMIVIMFWKSYYINYTLNVNIFRIYLFMFFMTYLNKNPDIANLKENQLKHQSTTFFISIWHGIKYKT